MHCVASLRGQVGIHQAQSTDTICEMKLSSYDHTSCLICTISYQASIPCMDKQCSFLDQICAVSERSLAVMWQRLQIWLLSGEAFCSKGLVVLAEKP